MPCDAPLIFVMLKSGKVSTSALGCHLNFSYRQYAWHPDSLVVIYLSGQVNIADMVHCTTSKPVVMEYPFSSLKYPGQIYGLVQQMDLT